MRRGTSRPDAQLPRRHLVTWRSRGSPHNIALWLSALPGWLDGSRREIVKVCRQIAEATQSGEIKPEDIDENLFEQHLYTAGTHNPDLLIRTSGEMRLSNFLLWQMAYTEMYFTNTLWPDFDRREFHRALMDYQERDRRFGKV